MKLPIPNDWNENGDYLIVAFICPSSPQWRAVCLGALGSMTAGRYWDERTGRVTEAQRIGRLIYESMSYTSLDDWIKIQRMFLSTMTQAVVDLDSDLPEGIYTPDPISLGIGQAEMKHLVAAITSMPLAPLDDDADYTETGLRSALAPHGQSSIAERLAPDTESIWSKLEEIRAQLESGQGGPDYSPLLDEIERLLHAIATGVNSTAAPPTP